MISVLDLFHCETPRNASVQLRVMARRSRVGCFEKQGNKAIAGSKWSPLHSVGGEVKTTPILAKLPTPSTPSLCSHHYSHPHSILPTTTTTAPTIPHYAHTGSGPPMPRLVLTGILSPWTVASRTFRPPYLHSISASILQRWHSTTSSRSVRKPNFMSDERWGKLLWKTRLKVSHAGYIEETELGMRAEEPCEPCLATGEICMVYKPSMLATTTCSRCRVIGRKCSHYTTLDPKPAGRRTHRYSSVVVAQIMALTTENEALKAEAARLRQENELLRARRSTTDGRAPKE